MSDESMSLSDHLRRDQEEMDAALPATDGYTGEPCQFCGRIRVYLRRDGQLICEKCEQFQSAAAPTPPGHPA